MSTPELPPLPFMPKGAYALLIAHSAGKEFDAVREWAIAYGAACAAEEREACAKVCDELEALHWAEYRKPGPRNAHTEGRSDGASDCSVAIRARGTN